MVPTVIRSSGAVASGSDVGHVRPGRGDDRAGRSAITRRSSSGRRCRCRSRSRPTGRWSRRTPAIRYTRFRPLHRGWSSCCTEGPRRTP